MKKYAIPLAGVALLFVFYRLWKGGVMSNIGMKTSPNGIKAIQAHEGFRAVRYNDVAGYPTIGYGHKITAADNIGNSITNEVAATLLAKDLEGAENTVKKNLRKQVTQNQFDALVSLVFNVGGAAFKNADGSATRLKKALDAGDWVGAQAAMQLFNRAGGVQVAALVKRRADEASLFAVS